MKDIGESTAYSQTVALDINNRDEIVGYGIASAEREEALRFSGGSVIALDTELTNPEGWQLQVAYGVNDNGAIVGIGIFHGKSHGFMLVPQATH